MIKISWSALRTHEECKQKSYLARTKRLAKLDDKRNYFPGTVTDRVVRNWLINDPKSHLGEMPSLVEEYVNRQREEMKEKEEGVVRWRDPGDRARVIEECQEAVEKIEPVLLKHVIPHEYQPDFSFKAPLRLRNPVTGEIETIQLRGYMDLLVRMNGTEWAVWDVKHTRDNSYWRKTVGQLGFYDLAIELLFGKKSTVTGLMQPLCEEPIKPYTPSDDSRTQLLQRIVGMANDIWRDDRTPVPTNGPCGYCPTKHACVKFQPVVDDWGKKRLSF